MDPRWTRITAVVGTVVAIGFGHVANAGACVNDQLRQGPSADLPDCRAYELVTPASLSAIPKAAVAGLLGEFAFEWLDGIASSPVSADGEQFSFAIFGSGRLGQAGGGYANVYRSQRGLAGWSTVLSGPTGQQAANPSLGGYNADQGLQAYRIRHFEGRFSGSLDLGVGEWTSYVRYPDGRFRLAGEGTLPAEPDEDGNPNGVADEIDSRVDSISPDGDHIILSQRGNPVRLLPNAPAYGIRAVYDRTPWGLRLVSQLPDGSPSSSESFFEGASSDGRAVLFRTNDSLYVRLNDAVTQRVASGEVRSAGVSEDGTRVFYVAGPNDAGNLYAYDTRSKETTAIAATGDAQFVNVAGDGSHVFFVSPTALTSRGVAGAPNLYVWNGTSVASIATVSQADLLRETLRNGDKVGLAQFVQDGTGAPSRNGSFLFETSRTDSHGTALVFESDGDLTGFGSNGKIEVYLYDVPAAQLVCVSCGDGSMVPSAGSSLVDYSFVDVGSTARVANLTEDGRSVFFQSGDPLVPRDTNGTTDVYEWSEGHLSLISSGRSSRPSLLFGVTPDGHDVFIRTSEQLVAGGQEPGVPAIYDARIEGGFPPPAENVTCLLDECQGEPATIPAGASPVSTVLFNPHRSPRHHRCARRHKLTDRHSRRPKRCPTGHHHRKS
jgi:hypothetical protein